MLASVYDFLNIILPASLYEPIFMKRAFLALFLLTLPLSTAGITVVNLRMAFFADAISHSIFAGLALALLFSWPSSFTLIFFGIGVAIAVMWLSRKSNLGTDTSIGVVFSGILALGLAVLSRQPENYRKITQFLLGDILTVGDSEIIAFLFLNILSLIFLIWAFNPLFLESLSGVLAKTRSKFWGGLGVYLFGSYLALVVVLAVQTVGALLVTALLVVPAAAGRNFSNKAKNLLWLTLFIVFLSTQMGLLFSAHPAINTITGATIVLFCVFFFVLSMLYKLFFKKA